MYMYMVCSRFVSPRTGGAPAASDGVQKKDTREKMKFIE
jgi:hypothetical protein